MPSLAEFLRCFYRDQSGALNESFSDIFGVIVANWYRHGADADVGGWSWEIAPGWRPDGLPLRDLRNPRRLGAPEHMRDYLVTAEDSGGVHTNSSIHNRLLMMRPRRRSIMARATAWPT